MRHRVLEVYSYGGRIHQVGDIIEMAEGARRVRLHTRSFLDNHLHEPGDVVELAPGVEGPHKSRTVSHDRIDYGTNPPVDANRILGEIALDPLFDVIAHEPVVDEKPVLPDDFYSPVKGRDFDEFKFSDDVQPQGPDSAAEAEHRASEIMQAPRPLTPTPPEEWASLVSSPEGKGEATGVADDGGKLDPDAKQTADQDPDDAADPHVD